MSFKIIFWYWWALAAVLLVFEMMLPGVVFMFLAIGAAASGAVLLVIADLSLELQLFVFAIVSVASAVVLRPTLKSLQRSRPADATINARGDSTGRQDHRARCADPAAAADGSRWATEAGPSPVPTWWPARGSA